VLTYNYSREQTWPEVTQGPDICLHGRYPYANLIEQNFAEYIKSDNSHNNNGPYNAFVRNMTTMGGALFKNMQQWSTLGNLEIEGDYLYPLRHDWDNGPVIDLYGVMNNYTLGLSHNVAYDFGYAVLCRLDDVSYYYSSMPAFLAGYTWPTFGPNTRTGGNLCYSIPAYDRYIGSGLKTYIPASDLMPYSITTSGTISQNETWSNPPGSNSINITGNIIIDNNTTLTINPGTTIKFGGVYNIYVMVGSKIVANGTQANPILFTSATGTSRASWNNIYVYSSNNSFKCCTFQYGNWALKVHGYPSSATGNVIENCIFRNNDQGLRIHTNTAAVSNCQIYNNRHGLVCYDNTNVTFTGNKVFNNDRDGVFSGGHNVLKFFWNVIQRNGQGHSETCNGLYAVNSDIFWLG
jgi:parallel beta-helix repeat protein